MATPLMNLNLPIVGTTLSPTWASDLNAALTIIDSHNHSTGSGAKITPSGLNLNTDLTFNSYNATSLRSTRYTSQSAVFADPSDVSAVYVVNGDLYYANSAGVNVQITDGGGLNFATVGTIGGDFGQPGVNAAVTYSDSTKSFSFTRSSGSAAIILASQFKVTNEAVSSSSVTIATNSTATTYTITLPDDEALVDQSLVLADTDGTLHYATTLTADLTLSGNNTQSGNLTYSGTPTVSGNITRSGTSTGGTYADVAQSGTWTGSYTKTGTITGGTYATATLQGTTANTGTISGGIMTGATITNGTFTGTNAGTGIVPLGAVLATFPGLTGAYSCVATTAADSNGFVRCGGQTISDATSPMNGAVIPNINNDVFLMGSTSTNVSGGSNSLVIAHTHSFSGATSLGISDGITINGGSASLTGTTSFASTSHVHDMGHYHQHTFTDTQVYSVSSPSVSTGTWGTSGTGVGFMYNITNGGASGTCIQVTSTGTPWYTSGALNGGVITNTGAPNSTASVGLSYSGATRSGSVTLTGSNNFSGTTGSTGSGSDSRPKYISCLYIIRIK